MNMIAQVGFDIGREALDVSFGGARPIRIANESAAIDALVALLPKPCEVHLEASGGFDRLARRKLSEAGIPVHRHNPRKIRRLADVVGVSAKTDSLDAQLLANSGSIAKAGPPKSAYRERLCDVSRAIETLKKDSSDYKKRLKTPELPKEAIASYKTLIATFKLEVKKLEAEFVKLVRQSPLAERYKLLLTVPCVGKVTARVLTCELPEDLSQFTSKQIASYAGIAPLDNSSGKRKGNSSIGFGNMHVKGCLYMPCISALSSRPWAKELYARLMAKGRLHEQAMVALMRRLLVQAVAVARRGSAWKADPLGT